ncbi:MAG: cyclic nucleotide-binding domain-containing protein [Deltaproteobacteria bacterium]|nr:MAG: cyclic nucleotide-binding domain-containing protein [Deltaproteobacteria bacterium]
MDKGVAFTGNLEFLNLGELLQIIGNNAGTGILRITSKYAQEPGLIYIDAGDPVDAASGKLKGLEALFSLFGWIEGEFLFTTGAVNKKNVINKNRMEIILDGSRLVDDGKIKKLGPVSFQRDKKAVSGKEKAVPILKGPFVDYMYVVDEEEYFDGDEIVKEGGYGNWMWVILEGMVEISKETPKGPLRLLRVSDGAYVGSVSSFLTEDSVRNATAKAVGRVQLGMLDSQRLSGEYATMSAELKGVVISLDKRLKQVTDSVVNIYLKEKKIEEVIKGKKTVIEQGSNEERLFSIARGQASVARKTDSGYVPLVDLAQGDFFGHVPFIKMGHEPHSACVFASKDLKVASLNPENIQKEYAGLSAAFKNIIEHLATSVSVTTMIACEFQKKAK